jgi:hypothetical protein
MPARDASALRVCVQTRKCILSLKNKGFLVIVINGSESRRSSYDLKRDHAAHYQCFTNASSAAIEPRKAMLRAAFSSPT